MVRLLASPRLTRQRCRNVRDRVQRREFPGFPRLAPLLAGPRLMRSCSVSPKDVLFLAGECVLRVSARALQPAGVLGLRVIARQTGSQSEGFAPPAGRDHHDIRAADAVDHAREDAESRSGTPWARYAWHQHGIHRLLQSRRPTRKTRSESEQTVPKAPPICQQSTLSDSRDATCATPLQATLEFSWQRLI
jgi:hypothetical protein